MQTPTQTPQTNARKGARRIRPSISALVARALRAERARVEATFLPTWCAAPASAPVLRAPQDVATYLAGMAGDPCEQFAVLSVDTRNRLLRAEIVSRGDLNSAIIHPRSVFRPAIAANAAAIVVAHNHPSGDPAPSPEDIQVTKRLRECGDIIGIPVLDHVIIGARREGFIPEVSSMRERGIL